MHLNMRLRLAILAYFSAFISVDVDAKGAYSSYTPCRETDRPFPRCLKPVEVFPCDSRVGHVFDYVFDKANRTCVKVVGGCAKENVGFAVEASCIDVCWNCMSLRTRLTYQQHQKHIRRKEIFIKYAPYQRDKSGGSSGSSS